MNLVIKDIDLIITCIGTGFKSILSACECNVWISPFILLDCDIIEKYEIETFIKNKEIFQYSLNEIDIEEINELFRQYSENLTISDVSALLLADRLDNSIIVNNNGIYRKITQSLGVRCLSFNELYGYITNIV